MLYPTANQSLMIFLVFISGVISGVLFDLAKMLTFLSGKDKASKNIFEFFATILSFAILFTINLKFNYGQFRLYVIAIFLASLFVEQFLFKVLWTKVIKKCYNNFVERWKKKGKTKWWISFCGRVLARLSFLLWLLQLF